MNIALMAIDDGREDYLERGFASARESLPVEEMSIVLVNDSSHKLGFAGAIQEGWSRVIDGGADWVFHFETDFTFNEAVQLNRMIATLERHPHLAQMSLKRQAWNSAEVEAGGIVELKPDNFTECSDELDVWTEQSSYFTTNPSVYSTALCRLGWPQGKGSEGRFTADLLQQGFRFGVWGAKFDDPRVTHYGKRNKWTGKNY